MYLASTHGRASRNQAWLKARNASSPGATNALPYSVAPALAPLVLLLGGGDYTWLYVGAGLCALASAVAILPVRGVR